METSLPTPMTARVYVNLPEGMIDSMRLMNIDELFMKMIDSYDVKYCYM